MRRLLLLILALSVLLLAGCMSVEHHLVINSDGSGEFGFQLALDTSLLEMLGMDDADPLADMIEQAEAEGFSVTPFTDGDMSGFRATKHLPVITVQALNIFAGEVEASGSGLTIKEDWVSTRYEFELSYDMADIDAEIDEEDFIHLPFLEDFMEDMFYGFSITLPVEPMSHNADSVSSDGKTLTWNLKPGEQNLMQFTAIDGYSMVGLAVLGGVALLALIPVLLIAAAVIKRRRRARAKYYY